MLKGKESSIYKKISNLYDGMETCIYRIKAKELKKILGLSINEIDKIIQCGSIPILKYRQLETYYLFPIEYLINYFFISNGIGMANVKKV